MTDPTTILLPLALPSVANLREHWASRARRTKQHRNAAFAVPRAPLPCTVRLIRVAPRALDDDNLRSAFKAFRDGIADRLGVKDNDSRVTWEYDQDTGRGRPYAVRIEIFPGG